MADVEDFSSILLTKLQRQLAQDHNQLNAMRHQQRHLIAQIVLSCTDGQFDAIKDAVLPVLATLKFEN
jgi:hypothetical protein